MKSIILSIFVLLTFNLSAQKKSQAKVKHYGIDDSQSWHTMKIGEDQMKQKSYYNAVSSFSSVLEKYPTNEYVLYNLAHAYFKGRDYVNAEKYYKELVTINKKPKQGLAWFELAETYKYLGKYELAQKAFSNFKRSRDKSPEVKLAKKWAGNSKNYCKYAWSMTSNDSALFHVDVLPEEINSGYTDCSPTALGPDTLYFASLRKDTVMTYGRNEHSPSNVNLYYSVKDEDNSWDAPVLQENLSKEFDHIANGVFGPDNKFYYSKCHNNATNDIICGIYTRDILGDGNYGKEQKLSSKINKHGYTTTQPTFGTYKKRKGRKKTLVNVMYFSSNRPGGRGGMDIWYSEIGQNGKFNAPVNCGRSVNTIRDEVTPFYQAETGIMFFSSNYKYGLGGFDIFVSKGKLRRFRKATNLAMPINSSYDDTYFVPYPDTLDGNSFGYLVSNRPGGHALASETCCDDIYRFESFVPDSVNFEILLTQIVEKTERVNLKDTTIVLRDSLKTILDTSFLNNARIGYLNKWKYDFRLAEDSTLTPGELDAMVTWSDKKTVDGKASIDLRDDQDYVIYLEHPDYKDTTIIIRFPIKNQEVTLRRKEELKPKPVESTPQVENIAAALTKDKIVKAQKFVLDNMYFEYNMDIVKKESDESLDLLYTFLTNNPGVKVEIAGHTDSRGAEDYNLDLSQRRAESVVEKMVERGIKPSRMVAKGYGESQPIAENQNADGSDNPKGRRLNRRTEVIILSSKK